MIFKKEALRYVFLFLYRLELYVDDQLVNKTRLASGDARIAALREPDRGGLYIGGLRSGDDVQGMAASVTSLRGCVANVIIGGRLLSFDSAVRFLNADIGRCRGDFLFGAGSGSSIIVTPAPPVFNVTVKRPTRPLLTIAPTTTQVLNDI